jgi:hypothetical protein
MDLPHCCNDWRMLHASFAVATVVNATVLVASCGLSGDQTVIRTTFIAVARATCCRRAVASPT